MPNVTNAGPVDLQDSIDLLNEVSLHLVNLRMATEAIADLRHQSALQMVVDDAADRLEKAAACLTNLIGAKGRQS